MVIKKTTYECSHCGAEFPTAIQAEKHEVEHATSPLIQPVYYPDKIYPYMLRAVFKNGTVIEYHVPEQGTHDYNPVLDESIYER